VSLFPLVIAILVSLVIGYFAIGKWRSWSLLIISTLAIYWLQPAIPIRHLDFWLPTACLVLTILTWVFTKPYPAIKNVPDLITGLVIAGLIVIIGLTRYLGPVCCLTATRPPSVIQIILVTFTVALLSYLTIRFSKGHTGWIYACIIVIIGLFVILKSDTLATSASKILR
jgi:heme O synthase-like polyprenyltransferase